MNLKRQLENYDESGRCVGNLYSGQTDHYNITFNDEELALDFVTAHEKWLTWDAVQSKHVELGHFVLPETQRSRAFSLNTGLFVDSAARANIAQKTRQGRTPGCSRLSARGGQGKPATFSQKSFASVGAHAWRRGLWHVHH